MTALDILIAVAGLVATMLVVAGMILITPRGVVGLHDEATDGQGTDLSRAVPDASQGVPARSP
jgi:hypothetical protein